MWGIAHRKIIMKYIMKDPLDSQEAREQAYQEYSDTYKDVYGVRPRNELTSVSYTHLTLPTTPYV